MMMGGLIGGFGFGCWGWVLVWTRMAQGFWLWDWSGWWALTGLDQFREALFACEHVDSFVSVRCAHIHVIHPSKAAWMFCSVKLRCCCCSRRARFLVPRILSKKKKKKTVLRCTQNEEEKRPVPSMRHHANATLFPRGILSMQYSNNPFLNPQLPPHPLDRLPDQLRELGAGPHQMLIGRRG